MRRVLLDTHVLLWWLSDDTCLSENAKKIISNPANEIYISAATVWEISIKRALGKLVAPLDLDKIVEEEGFIPLPISLFHGEQAGLLPDFHKDPFDRMLIAQSQSEGLEIISSDKQIEKYSVRVIKAKK